MRPPVDAVVFDVGETLVCEERVWCDWARWLGVPPTTFVAVLGALIERRRPHLEVFTHFRGAGYDVEAERTALLSAGRGVDFDATDLYPDALPCLRACSAAGLRVGIVGNQPPQVTEATFADAGADLLASSAAWEVEKPDPRFFARIAAELRLPAARVAYVGDRLDNDVLPARAAGLRTVFLRRGPWGHVHGAWPEAALADVVVDDLGALPAALLD